MREQVTWIVEFSKCEKKIAKKKHYDILCCHILWRRVTGRSGQDQWKRDNISSTSAIGREEAWKRASVYTEEHAIFSQHTISSTRFRSSRAAYSLNAESTKKITGIGAWWYAKKHANFNKSSSLSTQEWWGCEAVSSDISFRAGRERDRASRYARSHGQSSVSFECTKNYNEAEKMFKKTLRLRQTVLGKEHISSCI